MVYRGFDLVKESRMEEECVKNGLFAPVTPGKQNVVSSAMINGRKQVSFDGEAETSGLQLFVDLGDLVCVDDATKFDCEATKVCSIENDTISINIPFPAMQRGMWDFHLFVDIF